MSSATAGAGSPLSTDGEPCQETSSNSSRPSSDDSPSTKLTPVEALSDAAIAPHLHLFSSPSTGLLQTRMRNTREWIAHNLDPPISERADVVPLQSLTDDIANALSLDNLLDCPYVSENAMILASAGLDPNLE
eukprot:501914-Rhodomonas_salina.1